MPSTQNETTIAVYNSGIDSYLERTPTEYRENHAPLLRWINETLQMVPVKGVVFEVGSGTGREAAYIEERGFKVVASDASRAFVAYLKQHGRTARFFNILKDEFPSRYDLIYANAVVPHFTPDDLLIALGKVHSALNAGGVFAFSVKQGEGEKWVNEKFDDRRYVHYWSSSAVTKLLEQEGFKVVFLEQDIPGDLPSHTWINITARKA